MTNVHAMIHKSTSADNVNQAAPMVELCIHGGGGKYGRGLTIADDTVPAVQCLKLMLDECINEDDERLANDDFDLMKYHSMTKLECLMCRWPKLLQGHFAQSVTKQSIAMQYFSEITTTVPRL